MCGIEMIGPGFQPSWIGEIITQGVALGWHERVHDKKVGLQAAAAQKSSKRPDI
jgi:hypothetical protein